MKIFVSVVSYRDKLLKSTIESLLSKKSLRHEIIIGIFEQTVEEDSLVKVAPELLKNKFIRYKRIDPIYADGVCWARDVNFLQLTDEDFIFEVDSHMIFDKDWDRKLINDYKKGVALSGTDKVIISGSCKNFEISTEGGIILHEHPVPMRSNVKYFLYQEHSDILGAHGDLETSDGNITPAIHICAGNFFTHAAWVKNVGANPDIYFEGEEQYMVLESFKQGYKLYHMSDIISYHYINTNEYDTKQWHNPIITMEQYSNRVHRGLVNFKKYLDSLDDDVLEAYHKYSGVDYINKRLDEKAMTYSIRVEPPPEEVVEETPTQIEELVNTENESRETV